MDTAQKQLNVELFGALHAISGDEELMKKAIELLKGLAKQKSSMDETEYLLSSSEMAEILRQGKEDIKKGNGRVVKIEDLWK